MDAVPLCPCPTTPLFLMLHCCDAAPCNFITSFPHPYVYLLYIVLIILRLFSLALLELGQFCIVFLKGHYINVLYEQVGNTNQNRILINVLGRFSGNITYVVIGG